MLGEEDVNGVELGGVFGGDVGKKRNEDQQVVVFFALGELLQVLLFCLSHLLPVLPKRGTLRRVLVERSCLAKNSAFQKTSHSFLKLQKVKHRGISIIVVVGFEREDENVTVHV